jgi:hypothetical protein
MSRTKHLKLAARISDGISACAAYVAHRSPDPDGLVCTLPFIFGCHFRRWIPERMFSTAFTWKALLRGYSLRSIYASRFPSSAWLLFSRPAALLAKRGWLNSITPVGCLT